jgi:hypothetical protein
VQNSTSTAQYGGIFGFIKLEENSKSFLQTADKEITPEGIEFD